MKKHNKSSHILFATVLLLALAGCGGGSSSSGGGTDEVNNAVNDALIHIALGDADYQPTQTERDCVHALGPDNKSHANILACLDT